MPLIEVDLDRALFDASHEEIGAAIQRAQVDVLGIVPDDRFQVFRPRQTGELKFDPGYNGVDRRSLLLIRILAVHMYPVATKRRLFEQIVANLGELGIRSEDVLIGLTENGFEDWYAGK